MRINTNISPCLSFCGLVWVPCLLYFFSIASELRDFPAAAQDLNPEEKIRAEAYRSIQ